MQHRLRKILTSILWPHMYNLAFMVSLNTGVYARGDFMVHLAGLDDKKKWMQSVLKDTSSLIPDAQPPVRPLMSSRKESLPLLVQWSNKVRQSSEKDKHMWSTAWKVPSMFQYCLPHKAREIRRGDNFDAKLLGGNTLDFDNLFSTKKHLGSIDGRDFPCQSRGNRTHFLRITRVTRAYSQQTFFRMQFSASSVGPPNQDTTILFTTEAICTTFYWCTFNGESSLLWLCILVIYLICLKYLSCVPLVHSLIFY